MSRLYASRRALPGFMQCDRSGFHFRMVVRSGGNRWRSQDGSCRPPSVAGVSRERADVFLRMKDNLASLRVLEKESARQPRRSAELPTNRYRGGRVSSGTSFWRWMSSGAEWIQGVSELAAGR